MKNCSRCKKLGRSFAKEESQFARSLTERDGLQHSCRLCQKERTRERRATLKASRTGQVPPTPAPASPPIVDPLDAVEITVDPLVQAYEESAQKKKQRELNAQKSALLEENQNLRDKIGELVKMQQAPSLLVYRQSADERADAVACAIASDWHVEEPVERESVHGLNEYNLEIAKVRAQFFFQNFLKLSNMMARDSKITTLFISALGDFISGWIHEELIATGLLSPGDAAKFWKDLFISGIEFLLRESSFKIVVDMIPGNHGRMTKQIHFGDPTGTSLETFAYHAIAGRFSDNPRVEINVASHAMVYRKFFEKFTLREIHGYEVKYGGGVGGLTIPLNKAIAQWDIAVKADLTVLGHFHQKFDGGRFLVNGSLIGYNTFAQAIKASFEEAQQLFWLLHARNGGQKSVVAPIWLEKAGQ